MEIRIPGAKTPEACTSRSAGADRNVLDILGSFCKGHALLGQHRPRYQANGEIEWALTGHSATNDIGLELLVRLIWLR